MRRSQCLDVLQCQNVDIRYILQSMHTNMLHFVLLWLKYHVIHLRTSVGIGAIVYWFDEIRDHWQQAQAADIVPKMYWKCADTNVLWHCRNYLPRMSNAAYVGKRYPFCNFSHLTCPLISLWHVLDLTRQIIRRKVANLSRSSPCYTPLCIMELRITNPTTFQAEFRGPQKWER